MQKFREFLRLKIENFQTPNTLCSRVKKIRETRDKMKIVREWCMYCGECAGVCPRCLIEVGEATITFDESSCKECEICVQACPVRALIKEE